MDREPFAQASFTRRALLARAGAGMAALTVATACGPLSPAEARAQAAPFKHLTAAEGGTLGALGDTLLPGAEAAGVAHFVDDQIGREQPLFILTYLDWPGPYLDFYRGGLAALDAVSQARYRTPFAQASAEQREALAGEIGGAQPKEWQGPPAPLFYYVVRSDAVDVVYGTPDGFAKLDIPYMPHIMPPKGW